MPYDDFQDQWNNYAANQNAAVDQQRLASLPDPRQLAAQQLVRQYAPKPPSYSNVLGHYQVNGEDVQAPQMQQSISPWGASFSRPNTGPQAPVDMEQVALGQYAHAKQLAAQDYLNRQSGDYAAGTGGRKLLTDPRFMQLPDDQSRNQIYQQVYGNSLGEDQQADRLGGNMTIHDLRYKADWPNREKATAQYFKDFEGANGFNPGDLNNPVQFDEKGQPTAGYDSSSEMLYSPGRMVPKLDPRSGNPTGEYQQLPPTRHYVPRGTVQMVQSRFREMNGQDPARQPQTAPPAPNPIAPIAQGVQGMFQGMRNQWGLAPADPTQHNRAMQGIQETQDVLQRNGINLNPTDTFELLRRATDSSNLQIGAHLGKPGNEIYTEQKLVDLAKSMLNERQRQAASLNALHRDFYKDSKFGPRSDPSQHYDDSDMFSSGALFGP